MISRGIAKVLISISIAPLFVLVGKFYKFRICLMRTDRLGHLSNNTQLFFIRQKRKLIEDLNYYLIAPSIESPLVVNKELLLLHMQYTSSLNKVSIVSSNFFYHFFFFCYSHNLIKNRNFFSFLDYKSKEIEFSFSEQTVSFNKKQKSLGNDVLLEMNITQKDKVVCVYTRDSSYLENLDNNIDWSYHNYRNTNIKSYLKAIKFLINEGYKVVRIGSEHSKSLNYINDNYIEYNLSKYKSGFMDLYLPYYAKFIIGCKSGATDLSVLFNTPMLVTDLATFVEGPLGSKDLFIQKKIVDIKGKIVPFKDIVSDERYYLNDGNKMYSNYGLSYIENTEEEIFEATMEMHNKMNNNLNLDTEKKQLLDRYHNEFCTKNKFSSEFLPISINWLEKNRHLYLNN